MTLDLIEYIEKQKVQRDIALDQVIDNSRDWAALCTIEMQEFQNNPRYHHDYPKGFTMTHIRSWLVPLVGKPHHANAWGSLAMRFIKKGLIVDTGLISRLGAKARKQPVYRWANG